jgi:general secretion pathway protein D
MNRLLSLTFAGLLVACTSTPTSVGRVAPDPFMPSAENPLLLDLEEAWMDELAEDRAPAFVVTERAMIPSEEVVSLELRGTPLANAIHMIADIAGVNIYLDADQAQLIDASFPSIQLDEALEIVLRQNGLVLEELSPGTFSVTESSGNTPTTARFELNSARAEDVVKRLETFLGEDAKLVADPDRNVVILHGSRDLAEQAATFITAVDQRKRQVLIEVGIFEASIDEGFELGVSHAFASGIDSSAVNILQAFSTPDDQFSLTFDNHNGDLSTTIQALRRHVGVELISSPRVMTATNTDATVEVLEEVPYVDVTTTTTGTTGGVGSNVVEEVKFKEAGITMLVHPIIQGDGLIDIKIDQTVSEVVDFFNEIPVIDKRHIATSFLVADGQTVVLGGLMQDRRRAKNEGVPLLGRLPLVGRLFGKDEDTTKKRELLVFLTPRILDPLQAAHVAKHYKEHYREARRSFELPRTDELESGR